ncbi:hypothetical protein ABXJ76_08850 [Methylobacter sp. G7]|uniref:hypothetical protein n=1 Tax=Methylobacter sp. G7 TaxID=3230117 RepID=UPI003D800E5F
MRKPEAKIRERPACCRINHPDGGAVDFVFHTILADIAIRADRDIQTRTITAGDHIFGPMTVDRCCGQIKHLYAGLIDLCFTGAIGNMPKGEFSPGRERKTVRVSAMPSPFALRNRMMRLALGTPAPAYFMVRFINQPLRPLLSSG